jgi:hypothetical protein
MLRDDALSGGLDLDLVLVFSEVITPLSGTVPPPGGSPSFCEPQLALSRQ